MDELTRCGWAQNDTLSRDYHDAVWGVPVRDDRTLFKMLLLEGMQAGLSWTTILKKMDAMTEAFDGFDPAIVAAYGPEKVEELLENPGIIRNRLKVNAAITNARAYFGIVEEFGSLSAYLWGFVGGKPIVNAWERMADVPTRTEVSDTLGKDLKKRGFKFVGTTIIYAFMQAVGMVNDHLVSCAFHDRGKG
jgi:DNA-3-methyladenine glycosylase I